MFSYSTTQKSLWRTALLALWLMALPAVGLSPFYYVTGGSSGETDDFLAGRPGVEVSRVGQDSQNDRSAQEQGSKSPATTRNDITLWFVTNSANSLAAPAPAKRYALKLAYASNSHIRRSRVTQADLRNESSPYSESGKARESALLGHKPSGLG